MDRVNVALAVCLVLVVALGQLLESEGPTRAGSGPLFESFSASRAARVEIEAQGRTVTLVRGDTTVWRIAEAFDVPVADGRVERNFLRALGQVSRADQAGSSRDAFGFEDAAHVRVLGADGGVLVAFDQSLERRPPSGGSFVSPVGEEAVYRSIALPVLEARPSRWWSSELSPGFEGLAERLAVELRTGDGAVAVTFERGDDGAWRRTDGEAPERVRSPQLVEGVLRDLARLRFTAVVAAAPEPGHGFDEPTARFVVEGARGLAGGDGEASSVTITVGGEVEDHLLATSTARPGGHVVAIDPAALEPVLGSLSILLAD